MKNRANIGLGMRLDYYWKTGRNLKRILEEFLSMPAVGERLKQEWKLHNIASWPLNFGSQKHLQHLFIGALLVSDAAGFVNPVTGGGIYRSLISGELAAEVIHEALQRGNISETGLQQYEKLCHEKLSCELRRSYYLQSVLLQFLFLIDSLVFCGQ